MDSLFDMKDPLAAAIERECDWKLSSLHRCVVYLRVSRELDTAAIARELQITPDDVKRLESEARHHLQAATRRGDIPLSYSVPDLKH